MRRAVLAAVLVLGAAVAPAAGQQAGSGTPYCAGVATADGVQQLSGPPLRFGITPGVQTGQLVTGAAPPRTPEDAAAQSAALGRLVPAGVPFVLRLHRLFWSEGEPAVARFLALADRYARAGYLLELQLRYHPTPAQEGDIAAWSAFVRSVVDRFGALRQMVAIQVTNEVNLPDSPDSSDGAYRGGRDALVQGVIAAKDEARRRGYGQLRIGFNWAYRADPQDDGQFWAFLRDAGAGFRQALDWVGLDAYPGTFFPPVEAPGRERDGLVNALSTLRCYTAAAAIPASVPIQIEENGFPTAPTPDRSFDRQAQALETMVRTVNDFRGTYNISDYRWFDLRDSDSTSANFQQQYGLMTDTYVPKPAFDVYRRLIAALSLRSPAATATGTPPSAAAVGFTLGCRRGRLLARVTGPVRLWALRSGRRVVARGRAGASVAVRGSVRGALVASVVLRAGERIAVARVAPRCRRLRTRARTAPIRTLAG